MDFSALKAYCALHATPGDEGAVFARLNEAWMQQGIDVTTLGQYGIMAHRPLTGKPKLLICAHADSPGYVVSEIRSETEIGVVALGGPSFTKEATILLKTTMGFYSGTIFDSADGESDRNTTFTCAIPEGTGVQLGDRVAWSPVWREDDAMIYTPHLDNRIGCAAVDAYFTQEHTAVTDVYDVIVAATALEEMTGFGANVLAHHIGNACHAVIAIDVTYTNDEQGVAFGKGPVLTITDASVVLSPSRRDEILKSVHGAKLPLQIEVYNYSGTDAKAFPVAGSMAKVAPILLATGGNHSPEESINKADLAIWSRVIDQVALALQGSI